MTVLPEFEPPALDFAEPFWAAVDRGGLALPRCSVCGRWQWYPEPAGTDCVGGQLRWEPVATTGTLYSFTRVHRSFLPSGADRVPYVVGLVELDGVEGPRLVANLDSDAEYVPGDRVRATFPPNGERAHPVFVRDG